MKIGKIWKYVLTIVLLLVPATGAVLSYRGFCFGQARFLSDTELIKSTVQTLAGKNLMIIDSSDFAIQQFFHSFPNCCSVDRFPDERKLIDVLTGWNTAKVEVNFERSKKYSSVSGEKYYKEFVSVSACGEVLKITHGTGTPTLEIAR